jgi:AcrR family transcriptional regulator
MSASPPTETAVTRDPRVARSRARVLEAATDLLVEGGSRAVTVDAVAERSGVAKSTMYRHFPSRTDLLVDVLRHNMPAADFELETGSFETALRSLLHGFAAVMADRDWARILPALMSLKNTIPDIRELTELDRAEHLTVLQTVLDHGIDEGLVAPDTDVVTTMDLLVGPLIFAALNDDLERLPTLADEITDRYVASCRRGPRRSPSITRSGRP